MGVVNTSRICWPKEKPSILSRIKLYNIKYPKTATKSFLSASRHEDPNNREKSIKNPTFSFCIYKQTISSRFKCVVDV